MGADFDVTAQAHADEGDLEAAIAVLERAVKEAPGSWPNWQLLGNYRSDLGRFDDAEAAYARALECGDAWHDSIRLNQAILASRRGEHERALELCESADDPELASELGDVRVHALVRVGRAAEAAKLAERMLDDPDLQRADQRLMARVIGNLARARRDLGASVEEVCDLALEALALARDEPDALELLHELETA
jgi:tetratricopeptide (TPR) repeat protein